MPHMSEREPHTRTVVGAMTGTSLDGIDVAVAAIEGTGLALRATLVRHAGLDLGSLRADLRRAASGEPMTAEQFARLAWALGERYAEAIAHTLDPGTQADLIAVHGQTIVHRPPISWQLLNPAPIAARFRCPLVGDLRQADLAAGGQGAPITPLADWVLFRDSGARRAIVNLGGFCNVTVLKKGLRDEGTAGPSAADIQGFDVCACNLVLDEVARRVLGARYDEGGRAAQDGSPDRETVAALLDILRDQRSSDRSLGTGDEAGGWVADLAKRLPPNDLAASAVEAVATCIGEAIESHEVDEIVIAGGGARNRALVNSLARHAEPPVRPSDELGVPICAREALATAVLGALVADGVPISLPGVTGCATPAPVAGAWLFPRRSAGGEPLRWP